MRTADLTDNREDDMEAKKRIVIIEDHTIFREGLKSLIDLTTSHEVVGEAGDGLHALRVIEKTKPDLVLLDLSMPRMDGFDVISDVKKTCPQTKILVLTIHPTEEYVRKSLQAGADGYILKKATREELLSAIDHALAGESYLYPGISQNIIQAYLSVSDKRRPDPVWDRLTRREREVLKLVAEGYKNREIAEYLFISVGTVIQHRNNLMKKLDIHNAAALTCFAIEHGLVTR